VVPAAGLGTRLRPATLAVPKPLLPLVDRPVIEWIAAELRAAGMQRIVIVTGRGGDALERHFAGQPDVDFVAQPEPRGLGDAVARAEEAVDGESFAVALGDSVLRPGVVAVGELVATFEERGAAAAIAVEDVSEEDVSRRGIVVAAEEGDRFLASAVVEKPRPEDTPSRLAVAGRYVLAPEVFDALRDTEPGSGGEIQLTDAIRRLSPIVGMRLGAEARRYDVGTVEGYCAAFVEWTLSTRGLGERVRRLIDADLLR